MNRKVVAIWVTFIIVLSFIVIIFEIVPVVKAQTTWYVDDVPGSSGPGDPPEDFTSIQDAINAAIDGDTVFVYSGIYFEHLSVGVRINLTGEDKESTIIDGGYSDDVVSLGSEVRIAGFTIINSGPGTWDAAIRITGSNNEIIDNLILNYSKGIYFILSPDNNEILYNTISTNNTGTHTVGITGKSSNNYIAHNNISDNERGIYFISSSRNNTIIDNNIFNNTYGICPQEALDSIIINNELYGNHLGIDMEAGSVNNTIAGNNITGGNSGIWIYSSVNNNTITRNRIWDHTVGITISKSSCNNTIRDNEVYLNDWSGISLRMNSNNNNILNNNISKNERGIEITNYANSNVVLSNNITDNTYGIQITSYSNNSEIKKNTVLSNSYGIYISSSFNNSIYHNNVICNKNQAIDDSNNGNQWDFGYPSGGNFWSDYHGLDRFKGAAQNIPGSDGIGDLPYILDLDSQDNYPLMLPIGHCIYLYRGWNLVSMPIIQSDTNLGAVLDSISGSFDAVQWFNINDDYNHWKHNSTSKPTSLNDLDALDHTMGFWMYINEPDGVLFEYSGEEPTQNQTIILHPGWNMVGYPSQTSYNRTEGLNNLTFDDHVDAIWSYDATMQKWEEMGESDYFEIGKGYYIHAKSECEWEVPL